MRSPRPCWPSTARRIGKHRRGAGPQTPVAGAFDALHVGVLEALEEREVPKRRPAVRACVGPVALGHGLCPAPLDRADPLCLEELRREGGDDCLAAPAEVGPPVGVGLPVAGQLSADNGPAGLGALQQRSGSWTTRTPIGGPANTRGSGSTQRLNAPDGESGGAHHWRRWGSQRQARAPGTVRRPCRQSTFAWWRRPVVVAARWVLTALALGDHPLQPKRLCPKGEEPGTWAGSGAKRPRGKRSAKGGVAVRREGRGEGRSDLRGGFLGARFLPPAGLALEAVCQGRVRRCGRCTSGIASTSMCLMPRRIRRRRSVPAGGDLRAPPPSDRRAADARAGRAGREGNRSADGGAEVGLDVVGGRRGLRAR